jgi:endonuclease YncB( thermonuclease family)
MTSILVFAKAVEVDPVTTDRYRRTVALVGVGGTVVNEELIRQGLTWVFTRYCNGAMCQEWESTSRPRHGRGSRASGQCRMPYRRGSFAEPGNDRQLRRHSSPNLPMS